MMAMIPFDCSAEDIARALNGRREGRSWMARCPAHDDRNPSLSITQADDRVLVHCFAGCSWQAVISVLQSRGLWAGTPSTSLPCKDVPKVSRPVADDVHARQRIARQVWSETKPLGGTLGEHHFIEHRKLDIRALDLTHAVRWHQGKQAVVGLMTDAVSGEPVGVHRTFLDANGAKVERKMLGRQGVVRLSPDDTVTAGLGITEGIEDGLAVVLSGWAPVWAATSAGAISRFTVLTGIEALTVFADADGPGIQAAESCAARWQDAGRQVQIASPAGAV
jgi:hypothetical protein